MTFPVVLVPSEGNFAAVLVGMPGVRAVGPTRELAMEAIREEIARRMGRGELVGLEVSPGGVSGLQGKYADDHTLEEIRDEAYRLRDAEMGQ